MDEVFSKCNLMLLDEKNISRNYIDEYFKINEIQPKQILEVSNMDLLIDFAKIGLGIACVIKEFVHSELLDQSLLEIIMPTPIEPREIGFAISKRFPISSSLNKFVDFCRKHDRI